MKTWRANLITKLRFTQGRRARAVWIDGRQDLQLQRTSIDNLRALGHVRRVA